MDKKTIDDLVNVLETIGHLAADAIPIKELTQEQWDRHRLKRITALADNALATLPEHTDTQLFRKLAKDTAEAQERHETGQEPDTWIDALATPDAWADLLDSVDWDRQLDGQDYEFKTPKPLDPDDYDPNDPDGRGPVGLVWP